MVAGWIGTDLGTDLLIDLTWDVELEESLSFPVQHSQRKNHSYAMCMISSSCSLTQGNNSSNSKKYGISFLLAKVIFYLFSYFFPKIYPRYH